MTYSKLRLVPDTVISSATRNLKALDILTSLTSFAPQDDVKGGVKFSLLTKRNSKTQFCHSRVGGNLRS